MEHVLLLALMCTAGQENPLIFRQSHLSNHGLLFLRAHRRIGLVKFRIARDRDEIRIGAEADNILRIDGRLHGELRHRADHVIQQAVQVAIARNALVTDAPVHHHDRNVHVPRSLQEVRPKLGFHRHEHTRLHLVQDVCRKPGQIEREVDDTVRVLDDAVCHLVAAVRYHGYENGTLREFFMKFFDQRACRNDFTDRSRMHPYAVFLGCLVQGMLGQKTQALSDAFDESLLTHGPDHEHWYDHDDDQDSCYIIK